MSVLIAVIVLALLIEAVRYWRVRRRDALLIRRRILGGLVEDEAVREAERILGAH